MEAVAVGEQTFKRKIGESICIDRDNPIRIDLVEIGRDYIRLKIIAPLNRLVCRKEVYESRKTAPIKAARFKALKSNGQEFEQVLQLPMELRVS